ncbi:uncharacterized protein BDR25DRAFT_283777 [Lindgomyces ingoldianus]|uniref:Uncharacterized protein n=1 Tax=Lindgomyces ingoldianus TaxID=673940 RepID=A0ACB6R009_9PLEO|nr:uncharacterized protein BDR25DRAFT_283777 [Lindgomyces ingoldianus]KAF2472367.1 hypothetical protein BDR25DRAFT_283777 [Lindgomyces ingoldianus]
MSPSPPGLDASTDEYDSSTGPIADALAKFIAESCSYACGGENSIQGSELNVTGQNQEGFKPKPLASPVTIRWDAATTNSKLVLPADLGSNTADAEALAELLRCAQPATFGCNGMEATDERYRKALEMKPSAFSTNFCPYTAGIVDAIAQALLPNATSPNGHHGVRAELSKLHVYTSPSGMFKAHFDTPQSASHFGTLVVCLPCVHEGGQLIVRHRGHSTTFDWSKSSNSLQWAAFYTDCEHEVLEVTSGHRLVFTYKLCVSRGLGDLAGNCDVINFQQLPLYQKVKETLVNSEFMPKGGHLGWKCSHAYAHGTNAGAAALPTVLKGSDMAIYEVFRSLDLPVCIRPVLQDISNFYSAGDLGEVEDLQGLDHVGHDFGDPYTMDRYSNETTMRDYYDQYPHSLHKVTWLQNRAEAEGNVEIAYVAPYADLASEAGVIYSYCALICRISPYEERVNLDHTGTTE